MFNSGRIKEEIVMAKKEEEKEGWPSKFGTHINGVTSSDALHGKVLLDTGANEVVRNYIHDEWVAIELGKPGTRKTRVKLASGKWYDAGMTANGEYMMYPKQENGEAQILATKGHWICPINRCCRELGINMIWSGEGCFFVWRQLDRTNCCKNHQ